MKLPETWSEARLGQISSMGSGDGAPQEEIYFQGGEIPFVRTQDVSAVRKGAYLRETKDSVNSLAIEKHRLRTWPKESLLIPKSGASALLNNRALLGMDACVVSHLAIVTPCEEVLPEYLYYWSLVFDSQRVIPDPSYPSIRLQDLARIKLPLPTLPEQQRVVEVLRLAERVINRSDFATKVQAILHAALDRVLFSDIEHPQHTLGGLAETRYGTSVSAEADEKSGLPVLRIPNVVTGEIDTGDIKYVSLPAADVARLLLRYGDVLVVRSNGNPDYVGRTAPVTVAVEKNGYVYASYLIRLRTDTEQLLPEYLSSYFNSPYGRAALRNAIRTTAGQSNLSGEALSRVKIPLPPVEQQRWFAVVWNSLQELRALVIYAHQLGRDLTGAIRSDAFSGVLTESWRDIHIADLKSVDDERRAALGMGAHRVSVSITERAPPERENDLARPVRAWLVEQLSEFQSNVRLALYEWKGTIVPDDTEAFDDFCQQWPIEHQENAKDRTRRTLEQLAALGLIAKVSLRNDSGDFVTGFRPLRDDENTRLVDAERITARLAKTSGGPGSSES